MTQATPAGDQGSGGGFGLLIAIAVGAVTGGVIGTLAPEWSAENLDIVGQLFLNALKMMVIPLVVASLITGVAGLGDIRKLGSLGAKTLIYYTITTALSVTVGIILVSLIQPGVGFVAGDMGQVKETEPFSFGRVVLGMLPPNLFSAAADMNILGLIIASLLFGAAVSIQGERAKVAIAFFQTLNDAVMTIVHWIMYTAPIGILALVAARLGQAGGGDAFIGVLKGLSGYVLTVLLGLGFHGFVTLPLILLLFARRNPLQYLKQLSTALVTAFSTASSSATLPLTIECCEENAQIAPRNAGFVLPLGATINMDGTALYEAVAAIFIAQAYGIDLSATAQLVIFLTATLAAIGAAGIPEAGLVTMVMVLQSVNLPVEGIGMILAIDWFLDRCRTTVNVWGDAVGAAVIDQLEPTPGPAPDPGAQP